MGGANIDISLLLNLYYFINLTKFNKEVKDY